MTLSEDLLWRGLVKDKTFEDIAWIDEPKTFYLGVDAASAPSLQVGNLAIFMLARRLLDAGWTTVLLVGGATSRIGDPGGKDSERDLKSEEEIDANVAAIAEQVRRLFADKDFELVNNYDWFKDVKFIEFLRDVGKHFSMTELTQREYIAERMGEGGSGISYAEFSYNLIQGYDYWHLFKTKGAVLQIGGSDQWGNMLSGAPLIRKKEGAEVHAMSMPLIINKATGIKFGKSEEGAVWLDPNLTSPYQFYQFWLNVDDDSVEDYLKVYTLLDQANIERVMAEFHEARGHRGAQKCLASEVTKLVHGEETAKSVENISNTLFGGQDYHSLTEADFGQLQGELPTVEAQLNHTELSDLLVEGQLASSKTEARRFLEESAVYINGQQFSAEKQTLDDNDNINGFAILRRGKNSQVVVKLKA